MCCLLLMIAVACSCMVSAAGLCTTQKENRTQSVAAFAMMETTPLPPCKKAPIGMQTLPSFRAEELDGLILIPGGMPFGVKFFTEGVTVVGFCDIETANGKVNPAGEAGLRTKDVILKINGEVLTGASDLTDRIAQRFGVTVKNVLTGFKYIGETIGALEKAGHVEDYILGFEESCGYLTAGYVRDKDGVLAAMLIAELAAYHRANGKTLYEAICELYKTYGYAKNSLKSYAFTGPQGFADMQGVMQRLRGGVNAFGKYAVEDVLDYAKGIDSLPASDVLKFLLAGGSTLTVRPSGTEPKLKVYFSVSARDSAEASETTEQLTAQIEEIIYQTK